MKKMMFSFIVLMLLFTGCGNKDFREEYPETLPDTTVWTEYPAGNILGLCGIGTFSDQGTTTTIVAIDGSKCEFNKRIMLKPEYLQGACPYGYFQFDESKVYDKQNYDYVKLNYDSRITLTDIIFDRGDERCVIRFDDETTLFYCNFKNPDKSQKTYQTYDTAKMSWGNRISEEKDAPPKESTGHSEYTILDIDHSEYEPSHSSEGVTFSVGRYSRSWDKYNIYGEIEEAGVTTLQFGLECDMHRLAEQDSFRLYRKENGEFVDITPFDVSLKADIDQYGHYITLYMQSTDLGELSEGDYRAEYGPYTVDFKMSNQLYVVD